MSLAAPRQWIVTDSAGTSEVRNWPASAQRPMVARGRTASRSERAASARPAFRAKAWTSRNGLGQALFRALVQSRPLPAAGSNAYRLSENRARATNRWQKAKRIDGG